MSMLVSRKGRKVIENMYYTYFSKGVLSASEKRVMKEVLAYVKKNNKENCFTARYEKRLSYLAIAAKNYCDERTVARHIAEIVEFTAMECIDKRVLKRSDLG